MDRCLVLDIHYKSSAFSNVWCCLVGQSCFMVPFPQWKGPPNRTGKCRRESSSLPRDPYGSTASLLATYSVSTLLCTWSRRADPFASCAGMSESFFQSLAGRTAINPLKESSCHITYWGIWHWEKQWKCIALFKAAAACGPWLLWLMNISTQQQPWSPCQRWKHWREKRWET